MYELDLQRQIDRLKKQLDDLATRDKRGDMGCFVYRSTTQGFTGVASLSWDTAISNAQAMWNIASPTRMTAIVTGWHWAGACFLYAAADVSAGGIRIGSSMRVDGVSSWPGPILTTTNAVDFRLVVGSPIYMTAGSYVEAVINQGFGVSKNISAATATNPTSNCGWLVRI